MPPLLHPACLGQQATCENGTPIAASHKKPKIGILHKDGPCMLWDAGLNSYAG